MRHNILFYSSILLNLTVPFQREIFVENTKAGLKSARRSGRRPKFMSDKKMRTAKAMLKDNENYSFIPIL